MRNRGRLETRGVGRGLKCVCRVLLALNFSYLVLIVWNIPGFCFSLPQTCSQKRLRAWFCCSKSCSGSKGGGLMASCWGRASLFVWAPDRHPYCWEVPQSISADNTLFVSSQTWLVWHWASKRIWSWGVFFSTVWSECSFSCFFVKSWSNAPSVLFYPKGQCFSESLCMPATSERQLVFRQQPDNPKHHHPQWEDTWSAICPRTCRGNPWCFEECLGSIHHQGSEQNACWLCAGVYGSEENMSFSNFPERYSDEHSLKIGRPPLDFLNLMNHR